MESLTDKSIQFVKGVGPKKFAVLSDHGLTSWYDLLHYFPRRYLDRTNVSQISELALDGDSVTVVGRITGRESFRGKRRRIFRLTLEDDSGSMTLVFFNNLRYFEAAFKEGDFIAATGKPTQYRGWSFTHPSLEKINLQDDDDDFEGRLIPLYPGTEALRRAYLDSRGMFRIVSGILDEIDGDYPDCFAPAFLQEHDLVSYAEALEWVHRPPSPEQLKQARYRLKFNEFFFLELMLALRKYHVKVIEKGICFHKSGDLRQQLLDSLPFSFTADQEQVTAEILKDMRSPQPMNRLLEGDVGSGKTLVAVIAMLLAVENGYQCALMVPTEILADQHYRSIMNFVSQLPVNVTMLTGGLKSRLREQRNYEITSGNADIIIGTHALFQKSVRFNNLGLVVIDEQHRFGVLQRGQLRDKGVRPDTLVMSATPIPRTLALSVYGDLDISLIKELPPGRQPISTHWRYDNKLPEIMPFIRDHIEQGEQAYIVYPLVEDSDKLNLRAATRSRDELAQKYFLGIEVGLIHGRMQAEEKDSIMQRFAAGEIQVLVSTTVVEVGVDNPSATIMAVIHAERFGLSQLHQLRGRVGRGPRKSYCILVAGAALSEEGRYRLNAMIDFPDGFNIAEADMRLRGSGDFFGTRQHGLPTLKIADLIADSGIMFRTRDIAFQLVQDDPRLLNHPRVRDYYLRFYEDRFNLIED
jgi:ATP-dependent DNA helicase RecG